MKPLSPVHNHCLRSYQIGELSANISCYLIIYSKYYDLIIKYIVIYIISLLFRLILSAILSTNLQGSKAVIFSELIDIVSCLHNIYTKSIILLSTFLVTLFARYNE